MKIQIATIAIAFLATSASAEHYKGVAEGNPDLGEQHQIADSPANLKARMDGTGSVDMHQGLSNPDLSPPPGTADPTAKRGGADIDVHQGFSSPDLSPPPGQ